MRPLPVNSLASISERLSEAVDALHFAAPTAHVYNPLRYAAAPHRQYCERYGLGPKEVVLVGMNPGPFGMVQTGIPFGEINAVRDWMGIEAPVSAPVHMHPKRPVLGFACTRSEVSGRRLWGWAAQRFSSADAFFQRFFVLNYCPLAFVEASGRNRTPDKLPKHEQAQLFAACDEALAEALSLLKPTWTLGIGGFAHQRLLALQTRGQVPGQVESLLHPSPASPVANRGWAEQAEKKLRALGIALHTES